MNLPDCPRCGGIGYLRDDVPPGHKNFGKLFPCPDDTHTPARLKKLSELSNLPEEYLKRTLDDIDVNDHNQAMLEAARGMMANPFGWLYLHGGPGNAKSEVLIALVNYFNNTNQGPAVYTKLTKVIEYMRDAFDERKRRALDPFANGGYVERFQRIVKVKVLAIDEMDKVRRLTDFTEEFRFDFLDDRYISGLAGETVTIFAGNEDPATFPEPIWDRFSDGRFKIIENKQPSARPTMRRK